MQVQSSNGAANAVSRSHVVQIAKISTLCSRLRIISDQSKLETKQWVLFFLTTNQKWEQPTVFRAAGVVKNFYSELQKKMAAHEVRKYRVFSLCFEDFEDENKRKEGIKAVRDSSLVSKSLFDCYLH